MSKIWVGSFFERFGAYKLDVLAHEDARIAAVVDRYITQPYIDTEADHDSLVSFAGYVAVVLAIPIDPVVLVERPATPSELWVEGSKEPAVTYRAGKTYMIGGNFVTIQGGEEPPAVFEQVWDVSAGTVGLIAEGAVLSVDGQKLIVTKVAE